MQDPIDAYRFGPSQLDGKVALITGGTKNIGGATARAFAAAGADLVITARNEAGLEETRTELLGRYPGKVVAVAADVSSDADIVRSVDVALETFGGVDVLVNNAYYSGRLAGRRPGLETMPEQWDAIWRGNVLAPYRYTQLLEPAMRERGKGSIINVLSIPSSGSDRPTRSRRPPYSLLPMRPRSSSPTGASLRDPSVPADRVPFLGTSGSGVGTPFLRSAPWIPTTRRIDGADDPTRSDQLLQILRG